MLPNEGLKLLHIREELLIFVLGDSVTRHWDTHSDTLSLDLRVDLGKPTGRNLSLEVVLSTTILKCEQALPDRVTVADSSIVNECKFGVAPAKQIPRNLASKRAGAQQQALRFFENVKIELRCLSPFHEFQVQSDSLLSQIRRIHLTAKLNHFRLKLTYVNWLKRCRAINFVTHLAGLSVAKNELQSTIKGYFWR